MKDELQLTDLLKLKSPPTHTHINNQLLFLMAKNVDFKNEDAFLEPCVLVQTVLRWKRTN